MLPNTVALRAASACDLCNIVGTLVEDFINQQPTPACPARPRRTH